MLTAVSILVDSYLDEAALKGLSLSSLKAYRGALDRFHTWLPVEDLREVTTEDLAAYWKAVMQRLAPESAYLYLRSVKQLFKFLADRNEILLDPSESLTLPKLPRHLVGPVLSESEFEKLAGVCDVNSPVGLRDRALLEFLYSTGLRSSEVCRMAQEDVSLPDGTALVRKGKGAKDRVVPVGKVAAQWLDRYLSDARPGFSKHRPDAPELFIGYRGNPLSPYTLGMRLRVLGDRAKLAVPLTCHTIRRTLATVLLRNGASPAQVAAILGHEDLHSLSRYVSFVAREIKAAHKSAHPRETEHE